ESGNLVLKRSNGKASNLSETPSPSESDNTGLVPLIISWSFEIPSPSVSVAFGLNPTNTFTPSARASLFESKFLGSVPWIEVSCHDAKPSLSLSVVSGGIKNVSLLKRLHRPCEFFVRTERVYRPGNEVLIVTESDKFTTVSTDL